MKRKNNNNNNKKKQSEKNGCVRFRRLVFRKHICIFWAYSQPDIAFAYIDFSTQITFSAMLIGSLLIQYFLYFSSHACTFFFCNHLFQSKTFSMFHPCKASYHTAYARQFDFYLIWLHLDHGMAKRKVKKKALFMIWFYFS